MFFGCLSRGRIGGILAGLGFNLPGFVLMLAASYLYTLAGFGNVYRNEDCDNVDKLIQRTLQSGAAAVICLLALAAGSGCDLQIR